MIAMAPMNGSATGVGALDVSAKATMHAARPAIK